MPIFTTRSILNDRSSNSTNNFANQPSETFRNVAMSHTLPVGVGEHLLATNKDSFDVQFLHVAGGVLRGNDLFRVDVTLVSSAAGYLEVGFQSADTPVFSFRSGAAAPNTVEFFVPSSATASSSVTYALEFTQRGDGGVDLAGWDFDLADGRSFQYIP